MWTIRVRVTIPIASRCELVDWVLWGDRYCWFWYSWCRVMRGHLRLRSTFHSSLGKVVVVRLQGLGLRKVGCRSLFRGLCFTIISFTSHLEPTFTSHLLSKNVLEVFVSYLFHSFPSLHLFHSVVYLICCSDYIKRRKRMIMTFCVERIRKARRARCSYRLLRVFFLSCLFHSPAVLSNSVPVASSCLIEYKRCPSIPHLLFRHLLVPVAKVVSPESLEYAYVTGKLILRMLSRSMTDREETESTPLAEVTEI